MKHLTVAIKVENILCSLAFGGSGWLRMWLCPKGVAGQVMSTFVGVCGYKALRASALGLGSWVERVWRGWCLWSTGGQRGKGS